MEIKTISLLDQIRASRAIYDKALEDIDSLSDNELPRILVNVSGATADRILAKVSTQGLHSLTDREKRTMEEAARHGPRAS